MGRMTYVKALMCLLFPSAALVARAQHPVAGDLKCRLTGRMLMDGGVYLKNDNQFGNGTEFNDLRLGVKATYQNWSMKMEVGYVGNKVSIRMPLLLILRASILFRWDNFMNLSPWTCYAVRTIFGFTSHRESCWL